MALMVRLPRTSYPWEKRQGWGENHYFCSSFESSEANLSTILTLAF